MLAMQTTPPAPGSPMPLSAEQTGWGVVQAAPPDSPGVCGLDTLPDPQACGRAFAITLTDSRCPCAHKENLGLRGLCCSCFSTSEA